MERRRRTSVQVGYPDLAVPDVAQPLAVRVPVHPGACPITILRHEQPRLAVNQKRALEPGMVVTVEPGIYLPGAFGVRIEDDILVTETGHKILTRHCPHSPLLP